MERYSQNFNCPVCSGVCSLLDVVDFNKSCEEFRGKFLSLSGIPVYYALCEKCGFCFTPELMNWELEQFEKMIYNNEYALVDPDYIENRPRANAVNLISMFGDRAHSIKHLDYGGGSGLLVKLLKESNWQSTSYDPFVDRNVSIKQLGEYDLITAFEVFEHVPDVSVLMSCLRSLLAPNGLILFSTLLSDDYIQSNQRINWWYASPRNGHISLFSRKSLKLLAQKNGFNADSFSDGFHVFFTSIPVWADHLASFKSTVTGDNSHTVTIDSVSYSSDEAKQIAFEQLGMGNFSKAEAIYLQLTKSDVVSAELFKNYGNTLLFLKKYQEAEQAYRKALEINPDYAEAYNNLGNVLRIDGRFDEAEIALGEALRLLPDSADIHNSVGILYTELARDELAEKAFRKAVLLQPDKALFYLNRGNALRSMGRLGTALKSYRKALELDPVSLDVHISLAQVLIYLDDIAEAEQVLTRALEIHPSNARIYTSLGVCCFNRGLFADAEAAYLQALAITPDYSTAQFNWALLKLSQGDLLEGFKCYEHRFDGASANPFRGIKDLFKHLKDQKRWSGESVDSKTLLIITEQGAGDILMMMRYIPLLKTRGFDRLMVYCETRMVRLFKTFSEVDEVFSKDDPLMLTGFEYYCPMMSLPYLFQTNLNNIPAAMPCIVVADIEREKWRKLLEGVSGLKVGLVWAGSSINLIDTQRSIQISEFRPLAIIDDISLISLQKGEQCGQAAELGSDCIDYMDMCNDYLDTAALIMELDLVISVDTSVAHLAGALGKPVWLLNRFGSEWRWMLDREDSPWYPSMRIFNQKEKGNWTPVIDAVVVELKNLVGDRK